jgi:hypothetical protein
LEFGEYFRRARRVHRLEYLVFNYLIDFGNFPRPFDFGTVRRRKTFSETKTGCYQILQRLLTMRRFAAWSGAESAGGLLPRPPPRRRSGGPPRMSHFFRCRRSHGIIARPRRRFGSGAGPAAVATTYVVGNSRFRPYLSRNSYPDTIIVLLHILSCSDGTLQLMREQLAEHHHQTPAQADKSVH